MHLRRGVLIARPFGIRLVAHGSWFPAALLLVLQFALGAYGDMPLVAALPLGVLSAVVFFTSLVAHELAHALVARRLRIDVLDITLFVFGGVARIAREPSRPRDEVAIALAGPVASGVIGVAALSAAGSGAFGRLLGMIGLGNLVLVAFNLLPGFPLDGGRVLRAWIWSRTGDPHRAAVRAAASGQAIGALLALCGAGAVVLDGGGVRGVWFVVLGAFLYALATSSRRASRVAARLGAEAAGRWARPFAGTLRPDDTLDGASDGPHAVTRDGRLAGVVASGAPRAARAADVMVPWTSRLAFPAAEPLTRALERLASEDVELLVVVDDAGAAVGVLDHAGVRARMGTR